MAMCMLEMDRHGSYANLCRLMVWLGPTGPNTVVCAGGLLGLDTTLAVSHRTFTPDWYRANISYMNSHS